MSVIKKLRFVLINFCFLLVCNAQVDYFNSKNWAESDYQDPHSFYYDKHTKKENVPPGDNDDHEIGEYKGGDATECYKQLHKCKSAQNTDVADELLSRRIVNIIISRGQFEKDGSYFNGRIELQASSSELEALKNFGLGKLTLREVDPILNKVIQAPAFDMVHETAKWLHVAESFLSNLLLQIWNFVLQNKEYVAVALALPFSVYFLKGMRLNFWIALTVGIQLIFVGSFFITYWRLIQEAQIKHAAAQMKNIELPVQCQPHKMGILDKLRSFFVTDDCEKYFEAVMRDPRYEVTPAQALTHMLANSMFEPVAIAGKTISMFLSNVTGDMPWLVRWFIQSAFFLGFFPVLILFIVLILGGTLNLGFGPFSIFSLRGPQSSASRQSERTLEVESKKQRQPIEVLLNVLRAQPDNILSYTVTNNVHLPPSIGDGASERSNNLAITTHSECCGGDKQKKEQQKITYHYKACGDSETTDGPGTSKESDEAEIEYGIEKLKVVERGGGDHGCSSEDILKT